MEPAPPLTNPIRALISSAIRGPRRFISQFPPVFPRDSSRIVISSPFDLAQDKLQRETFRRVPPRMQDLSLRARDDRKLLMHYDTTPTAQQRTYRGGYFFFAL